MTGHASLLVILMLTVGWNANAGEAAYSKVGDIPSAAAAAERAAVPRSKPVIDAYCARPVRLRSAAPTHVSVPRFKNPHQKPNFIIILTDDQGFDDMGLHNPKYVQTPNLDRFLRESTVFDNFYVQPECAQSRAELLTGRSYPRTSTMMVHGGYDFIHPDEVTAGRLFQDAGYLTAQIGKWHEHDVAGYGPNDAGFEKSWHSADMSPESAKCLLSYNGQYAETAEAAAAAGPGMRPSAVPRPDTKPGTLTAETALMNKIISFIRGYRLQRKHNIENRPMLLFYPPRLIHKKEGLTGQMRAYPPAYRDRFMTDPKYQGIANNTLDAWATLAYMDDLLGGMFRALDNSTLHDETYVFLMSDNGPHLDREEMSSVERREIRVPSGMQGSKSTTFEGGVRGFLAVRGPGVRGSITDSTLLHITDILPTLADLAGIPQDAHHLPWDGISFKNLLLSGPNSLPLKGLRGRRGTRLSNAAQSERFVFALGPACWDPDAVLELGPGREVLRPQPLLDYDRGGMLNTNGGKAIWLDDLSPVPIDQANPGFEPCIAVRYKDYKWSGLTKKVYRLVDGNHIELPCNEVTGPEADTMAKLMSQAARNWWKSVVAEPHSFIKPTFYLGLPGWIVSNINAEAAHQRTPGHILLKPRGARGFQEPGDRMCWKVEVLTAATYQVVMMYQSAVPATFTLSLGPYHRITTGTAHQINTTLPASNHLKGWDIGQFRDVPVSKRELKTELCLELTDTPEPGRPVFRFLAAFRLIQRTNIAPRSGDLGSGGSNNSSNSGSGGKWWQSAAAAAEAKADVDPVLEGITTASAGETRRSTTTAAVPSPEPDFNEYAQWLPRTNRARPADKEDIPSSRQDEDVSNGRSSTDGAAGDAAAASWAQLRAACGWPAGQGVLQHMYSPIVEGTEECGDCMPDW